MGSFPMNLFSRVGIALWGRDNAAWAQELGIAERIIRRYENGDMEPPEGVWRELLIHVQRVRDTWAYDQTEEDGWTELADQIKARRSLATRLFLRRSGRRS
jgi:ribosome-binding protein aMBF1 (putative translation factor)